jgi:hypothetical protein
MLRDRDRRPGTHRAPRGYRLRHGAALALLVALGCSTDSTPTDPGTPNPAPGGLVLASGTLVLPAAIDQNDAGSHEVFVVLQALRPDLMATSGRELVVALRDAGRPGQQCPSDEPEDGCASIDWSDDPASPRVPADGRFLNRLRVELDTGVKDLYLSRDFRLKDVPDIVDPNHRHTAIGGNERQWVVVLPTDLAAGSEIELRLVMTKWQAPDVRIGYEIRIPDAT